MARPPLPLGTWGSIRIYPMDVGPNGKPKRHRAVTDFRDFDGKIRRVSRFGKSKAAAENALKIALKERSETSQRNSELTRAHRFGDAARIWIDKITAAAKEGRRSLSTVGTYRQQLDRHVLPALAELRLGEVSTPLLDKFIHRLKEESGIPTAKTCRSIVSGVMGLAVRYGAVMMNPVREVERIEGQPKKVPRALTKVERAAWFAQLDADEDAQRRDLPDLCRFMLATGVRIGEASAVLWSEVHLEAGTVSITSTIIRVKGVGLIRKTTKSKAGQRVLRLPTWALDMLLCRYLSGPRLDTPLFPDDDGGWRDPSNTARTLREARGSEGFAWVTAHAFRKTVATLLDDADLSARVVADQLGHAKPSMTQDVYLGRNMIDPRATAALNAMFPPKDENRA